MYSQFILLAVVMIFIIGRLIGSRISFMKQVMASLLSVIVTSAVYYYGYLQYDKSDEFGLAGWLWLLSMVIVSLLFYLFFEMFDPIPIGERGERLTDTKNPFKRLSAWWNRQRRYIQVLVIAIRYGVGKNLALKRTPVSDQKLAVSLRKTLEACGGFFIKFGQVLSTRSDLLPPAIVEELSHLQENVVRLTTAQVEEILAKELNQPQEDIFKTFEMEPLAAASIGQVHRATLLGGGKQVVVKLLRPDISSKLQRDLDILVRFAAWASGKSAWARNIGFLDLAKGFSAAMKEETDFRIEARNFAQVTASLLQSPSKVKIPHVYREYSNAKVLVIEYMEGASVKSGTAILDERGIDRLEVQRRIFDCMLEQIFLKGIFHADPHPGNVYILNDGTPALLDFGSVGRLGTLQLDALKRLLIGFEKRSPYMIKDALLQLVETNQDIDQDDLEQALSQLLVQTAYDEAGGSDAFIQGLFRMIGEFGLSFYPNVAGAFRSLITLEGTMMQLNPSFSLMEEARRFAIEHAEQFLPINSSSDLKETAANELLELLPVIRRLPRRLDHLGSMLEKGEFSVKVGFFSDKANTSFVTKWISQALLAFVGTAFGGISIGLLSIGGRYSDDALNMVSMFGYTGILISAVLLIRVAIHAVRHLKQVKE
ncbi:AarF/ABC1/UbiB kinase family protein [Paenibacillus pinisoli]|uniref:AarF/ABC1/UbiB kinase family protein n=1 Tax=Paenibacillus pinisoli TaxID=1276110 RepID=A0A3A6PNX9_9BACL|nr:AarF/UbiB family protein [Paenibacillus pinisoli]RJX39899.1 AarF/ABC1/UbiB kinase family protein [Paenibacillus pinisoli]